MNQVTLFGRLTKDPELRYSQSGMANVFVTIAVDRGLSKEKREQAKANNQPTADFISCKAFGKTAEILSNYFRKGSSCLIEGKITTGSYENNAGQRIYTTDVLINRFYFTESKNNNEDQNTGFAPSDGRAGEYIPVDEDEIPF